MLIDNVVEHLRDGRWHSVRSIAEELNEPEGRIWEIIKFCQEFDFVAVDGSGKEARLDERFRKLLD
jgi:predicted transcriptional regulator